MQHSRPSHKPSRPGTLIRVLILFCAAMAALEAVTAFRDREEVHRIARTVVAAAGARTARDRVVALRDYVRRTVSHEGLPQEGRPFLRSSAAETLRTGRGWCGEGVRAFIMLADGVGISAQRINLFGRHNHVVAEAEVGPDDWVIADCQQPPQIRDLEKLDQVILRPEYDDYSTLNLRRLGLGGVFRRIKLEAGWITYLGEQPHVLKALLWLSGAAVLLGGIALRGALRAILARRGWVHRSALQPPAADSS